MNGQATPPNYNEKFDRLTQLIWDSNKLLERMATRPMDAPKLRTESLTLNTNPVTFQSLGYLYFAIFARGSVTVHVKQRGLDFDVILAAGFNQVYLLEMAELTTDTDEQVTLMWSAYPFN